MDSCHDEPVGGGREGGREGGRAVEEKKEGRIMQAKVSLELVSSLFQCLCSPSCHRSQLE